jgi:hypothetical protein
MTMKYKINLFRKTFAVLVLGLLSSYLPAQNSASTLELKSIKTGDESRRYDVKLTGESEEGAIPVFEAKIEFFTISAGKSELLGSTVTSKEGNASIKLEKGTRYLAGKEGENEVKAVFAGQGKLSGSEASVKFRDLDLQITLAEKDSLNTIVLKASSTGPNGEVVPLKETNFNLYVQGLFTKLKIGECFVDGGEGTFDFPKNIPGDENGNLQIYVRLEENETFGEVEKTENAKWGNHRSGFVEPVRSLWTSGAPIWMITTLIILLAGVWSHYMYAVIQMIKIRKEGKKLEKN